MSIKSFPVLQQLQHLHIAWEAQRSQLCCHRCGWVSLKLMKTGELSPSPTSPVATWAGEIYPPYTHPHYLPSPLTISAWARCKNWVWGHNNSKRAVPSSTNCYIWESRPCPSSWQHSTANHVGKAMGKPNPNWNVRELSPLLLCRVVMQEGEIWPPFAPHPLLHAKDKRDIPHPHQLQHLGNRPYPSNRQHRRSAQSSKVRVTQPWYYE